MGRYEIIIAELEKLLTLIDRELITE